MFVEKAEKSRFVKLIENHFTVIPPTKSQRQIDREEWLITGKLLFNRWFCIPAAFLIQFCRQFVFCWSIFNKPVDTLINGSPQANLAPITFYTAILFQGLSAAFMGPWLERNGPQATTILGAFLFGIGNLLTTLALSLRQMWLVYVGYGCIVGSAIGTCFICPISTLQKWFPDYRGLASGVAVWGVGLGAIINVKIGMYLMKKVGLEYTFMVIGLVYFLLILWSGLVLRTPPPNYFPEDYRYSLDDKVYHPITKEWSLVEALTSKDFWLIYVTFFAHALFGIVSMSRFSNMITDMFSQTPEHAATIISLYGLFELASRIIVPVICETYDKKFVYILSLSIQLVVLAGFYFIVTSQAYTVFLTSIWAIAVCYGGGFGTLSVFLTDKFGMNNVGPLFGITVTACSFVGLIGGGLSTVIFQTFIREEDTVVDAQSASVPYYVNAWWMLVVVAVGLVAAMFISPQEKNEDEQGRRKSSQTSVENA